MTHKNSLAFTMLLGLTVTGKVTSSHLWFLFGFVLYSVENGVKDNSGPLDIATNQEIQDLRFKL